MNPNDRAIARLMSHVEKSGECWLWTGYTDPLGYSRVGAPHYSGHVLAYNLLVGPVPAGLELDHTCNVRNCVNPEHLEPVTHAENARRASERQTHCAQGHAYTPENTYRRPSGHRDCRICIRARNAAYRARKAA